MLHTNQRIEQMALIVLLMKIHGLSKGDMSSHLILT